MWIDAQTLHVIRGFDVVGIRGPHKIGSPQRFTSQGRFEASNRIHGDGIDHLLMELRNAFRGVESVRGKQVRVIQIDGCVAGTGRRIDVHYFDIFAHRAGLEVRLPRDLERCLIQGLGIQLQPHYGVEGKHA